MAGTRAKSSSTGALHRARLLKIVLALIAIAFAAPLAHTLVAPSALAWKDRDGDRMRDMQREAERIMREAERKAREMAKQAEQARKEAERQREEAVRAAQEAARQAAQQAQKEAQKAAQKAAQQAAQQAAAQQAAKQSQQTTRADTREWRKNSNDTDNDTDTVSSRQNSNQDANQNKKQSDDGDDNSDKKANKRDDRDDDDDDDDDRADVKRADEVIQTPPRTMVELFNRWSGNDNSNKNADVRQQVQDRVETIRTETKDVKAAVSNTTTSNSPTKATKAAVSDDDKDANDGDDRGGVPPIVDKKRVGGRSVASSGNATRLEFQLPSLGSREILAANVNKASLDKLISLGFQTRGESAVGLLNASVTRLIPPKGMSASAATTFLHEQIPQQDIMQNRVYRPYRAAATIGGPGGVLPAADAPCSAERCYGAVAVHWSEAHRSCARSVRVGIIDTHVDIRHPTFEGRHISVGTFLSGARPEAKAAHGTGVLALLAGRRDGGTPGLIPEADFYAADVFFADGAGNAMTDTVSMLKALDWLDASGVRIINMSVSGPPDDLVAKAISALASRGVIITAAAGNGGPAATASYPAAYPEVISITAVDRNNNAYRQANHGGYIDLAAPGVGVWTAYPGASEGPQTGTSFAVPFATAAIAAVYDDAKPRSKADVLKLLRVSDLGVPGRDTVFGRGLLQAPAANCKPGAPLDRDEIPATASLPKKPAATASAIEVEVLPWSVPATGAPASALGFNE